ncbi:MAG: oligosaccharide flippase family protein [Actinomycetota bacterium]|nr:oligosaccharide flippase family protein [Actinomycetota bacterium]MDD5667757.1 oligosaccharide flippase family protein [Actinomycetota bacterium]
MERVSRLSKNTAALVSARIVTSALTFGMAIIINRKLGPELAGIYTYAFTLYTIFQVIPDFGIGNISIRDISQETSRMRRYFQNIVSLRLLLGLVAFGLLMLTNFITLALQGDGALAGEKFWVVFTIAFCLLIEQPFSNSLSENFIALERLGVVALVYMIMGIMKVAMSVYVVVVGLENVLIYLIIIYIITILYSILHLYPLYRRTLRKAGLVTAEISDMAMAEAVTHAPAPSGEAAVEALLADYSYAGLAEASGALPGEDPGAEAAAPLVAPPQSDPASVSRFGPFTMDGRLWRYLLGSAWPLAVVSAGVTIYAGIDIPLLSWLKGDTQVGLYSAAGMFAKAFVFLTLALNMAVLPAISRVGGKDPARLGPIWEKLLRYAWFLIIPLAVIVPILARPILVLQEHDFVRAWNVTWLTMGAMNFTFMYAISFPFFIVINKQKTVTLIVTVGLVAKVILALLVIPFWGYTGAAVTVLVSEGVAFVVLFWRLSVELRYRIDLLKFAAVPLLMLGTLYGAAFVLYRVFAVGKDTFMSSLQSAFIIAAALTILYVILAFATRALSRKGLHELNDLLTV